MSMPFLLMILIGYWRLWESQRGIRKAEGGGTCKQGLYDSGTWHSIHYHGSFS